MCLCEEASGPLKWEEVEDVQYVAGYLVRGHLAWLGDPVTPPQPGELPESGAQTLHYHGNCENEQEIRRVR